MFLLIPAGLWWTMQGEREGLKEQAVVIWYFVSLSGIINLVEINLLTKSIYVEDKVFAL